MAIRRILIADDEPYILRILAFKLRRAGYEALEANTGEEALAIARETPVDCIILDVTFPTPPSGFEVAERLRDDPRTCRIPVVFLTARALPLDRRTGDALGAAAFVTKPFSLQQVLDQVARLVPPA